MILTRGDYIILAIAAVGIVLVLILLALNDWDVMKLMFEDKEEKKC